MDHDKNLVINYRLNSLDSIYKNVIKEVEYSLFYFDFNYIDYTKHSKLSVGEQVNVNYGYYNVEYPVISYKILDNKVIEVKILIDVVSSNNIEYYLNDTIYTSVDIEIDGIQLTECINVIDVTKKNK